MTLLRQVGSLTFVAGLFTALFFGLPWYVTVADDPVIPRWLRLSVYSFLCGILIVLFTLVFEQKKRKLSADEHLNGTAGSRIVLLNSHAVPGREISDLLGLVQEHAIFAIWLGKD